METIDNQLTWHLLLMIVATVLIIRLMIVDWEDFSFAFYGISLLLIWAVYGGVFIW